ncbi:MAG: formylmethanofuran dehydrogenase [Thermodesulfobacterium geofontis]|uniref:Formylmethanofuran dehydrogenase n=1 Tax=Thermodesulfobacterium geofontis TaxID=1295609 RepID=A0A2N7QCU5_9BACT|nr:MAG: formylmethanofuran dehydrogenase [Thermodesulfobacterium geofontis]
MDRELLNKMFEFHGHKCWASALGLRAGLLALEKLGVKRANVKELFVILETGYNHGAACFGDGVQFATGCTAGKGNLIKKPRGKLAFTLIDPKQGKQIRICFNPKIREKIANSSFMKKRSAGVPPTEIPPEEVMEVVNLVLDSPVEDVLLIGNVEDSHFDPPAEVMGMAICDICGEMVARPYLRLIGSGQACEVGEFKKVCIDCSGYKEGFEK